MCHTDVCGFYIVFGVVCVSVSVWHPICDYLTEMLVVSRLVCLGGGRTDFGVRYLSAAISSPTGRGNGYHLSQHRFGGAFLGIALHLAISATSELKEIKQIV